MKNYQPHEIKLANEIADTLKDRNSLAFYLTCTRKYSEAFLREKLAKVMAKDESKITTSRGAYFNFLLNHDADTSNSRS